VVIAGLLLAPASCSEDSKHATGPVLQTITVTGPTVVGAADIARCDAQNDEATAALLDSIPGTVFTSATTFSAPAPPLRLHTCYGPSWGRHKSRTRPSVGSYEYFSPGAASYWQYSAPRPAIRGRATTATTWARGTWWYSIRASTWRRGRRRSGGCKAT